MIAERSDARTARSRGSSTTVLALLLSTAPASCRSAPPMPYCARAAAPCAVAPAPDERPIRAAIATLLDALLGELPEPDRAAARPLLAAQILPWLLRSLPSHPRPGRLVEVVRDDVLSRLHAVAPAQRLHALREVVCGIEMDQLLGEAFALGAARYLLEHPDRGATVARWIDARVLRHGHETREELAASADGVVDEVTRWSERARAEFPACWESHRIYVLHARFAARSARTGDFDVAVGSFANFLHDAGERSIRVLQIE